MSAPYIFCGSHGEALISPSADSRTEWTVRFGGLLLTFRDELAAKSAGIALSFNGRSPRRQKALKVAKAS